ncbi:hypothetical protein BpHYR1_025077 [Brachionus plicatilis]|uniref:Uncharacterized protein n=1 Tax=Brachionus plicatilis TaxID=10195 RepID=A0A3M7RGJ7_BRAPC|nr:hypothetical protein BpHYR1_025077 [Brachionus plicatilis]
MKFIYAKMKKLLIFKEMAEDSDRTRRNEFLAMPSSASVTINCQELLADIQGKQILILLLTILGSYSKQLINKLFLTYLIG